MFFRRPIRAATPAPVEPQQADTVAPPLRYDDDGDEAPWHCAHAVETACPHCAAIAGTLLEPSDKPEFREPPEHAALTVTAMQQARLFGPQFSSTVTEIYDALVVSMNLVPIPSHAILLREVRLLLGNKARQRTNPRKGDAKCRTTYRIPRPRSGAVIKLPERQAEPRRQAVG